MPGYQKNIPLQKGFPVFKFAFFFLLLTGASIGGILFDVGNFSSVLSILGRLSSSWTIITLLIVFLALDWYTDYLRYHVIAKSLGMDISFRFGIKLVFANLFFAYLTPGGTFGAPVIIYMLYKKGEKLSHAIALALIKPFLLFFLLLASGCLIFPFVQFPQVESVKLVQHAPLIGSFGAPLEKEIHSLWSVTRQVMIWSSFGVLLLTLMMASVVFFPNFAQRQLHSIFAKLRKYFRRNDPNCPTPRLDRWEGGSQSTIQAFALFGQAGWRAFFKALFATFLNLFFFLAISVTLLQGLGFQTSYATSWLYSYIYYFLIAFAPTPGASGLAEGGGYLFFQSLASPELVTSYILIWRFLSCYLVMIIGAVLFIQFFRQLRVDEVKKLSEDGEEEILAGEKDVDAFTPAPGRSALEHSKIPAIFFARVRASLQTMSHRSKETSLLKRGDKQRGSPKKGKASESVC